MTVRKDVANKEMLMNCLDTGNLYQSCLTQLASVSWSEHRKALARSDTKYNLVALRLTT